MKSILLMLLFGSSLAMAKPFSLCADSDNLSLGAAGSRAQVQKEANRLCKGAAKAVSEFADFAASGPLAAYYTSCAQFECSMVADGADAFALFAASKCTSSKQCSGRCLADFGGGGSCSKNPCGKFYGACVHGETCSAFGRCCTFGNCK